jgi:hypothetical protein
MPASPALIRLLEILQPSLAMYLGDSGIWSYPGPEELRLALAALISDHRQVADRAALILEEREVPVPKTAYPISFSGWHDVDLQHILPRVVAGLKRQEAELDRVAATPDDATAASLAAEAAKATRQHVAALDQIAVKLRAGLSAKPAAT